MPEIATNSLGESAFTLLKPENKRNAPRIAIFSVRFLQVG